MDCLMPRGLRCTGCLNHIRSNRWRRLCRYNVVTALRILAVLDARAFARLSNFGACMRALETLTGFYVAQWAKPARWMFTGFSDFRQEDEQRWTVAPGFASLIAWRDSRT